MSEAKFTKGPWRILPEECGKDYIRIRGTVIGERYKVANVVTPTYEGVHEMELDETRANANLIAAAPEMYEMLQAVNEWHILQGEIGPFQVEIDRLLAKARGEQ